MHSCVMFVKTYLNIHNCIINNEYIYLKCLKVLLMSRTIIINDYHCAEDAITQVAGYTGWLKTFATSLSKIQSYFAPQCNEGK